MGPVKVNLATFEYFDKRIVYSLILGAAIFVLMISAYNIQQSFHYQTEIFKYEGKIKRLEQMLVKRQRIENKDKKPLGKEDVKSLEDGVRSVNRLIAADVFPWERILGALEKEMPDDMVLSSFLPSKDFTKLTLKGRAKSMSDISLFVSKLESSGTMQKVLLSKIDLPEGKLAPDNGTTGVGFEINAMLDPNKLLHTRAFRPAEASSKASGRTKRRAG